MRTPSFALPSDTSRMGRRMRQRVDDNQLQREAEDISYENPSRNQPNKKTSQHMSRQKGRRTGCGEYVYIYIYLHTRLSTNIFFSRSNNIKYINNWNRILANKWKYATEFITNYWFAKLGDNSYSKIKPTAHMFVREAAKNLYLVARPGGFKAGLFLISREKKFRQKYGH